MASRSVSHVLGVSSSLSGRAWRWRGGNMELGDGVTGLETDILTQLLLTRGVEHHDDLLFAAISMANRGNGLVSA